MDGYREHPSDFELGGASESAAPNDVAAAIGTDERRMHVRAYNHWVSLLDGRDFPSIEDLEPGDVEDFAAHSVLLDFTCGHKNPAIPYIGAGIRDECGLDENARTISDVPSRSLLSRLTDHYMQIIANRAPIGFEAEFLNQRGENICYRGILMPFSSDGEAIDFIYGVINWKSAAPRAVPHPQPVDAAEATAEEPEDADVLLLDEEAELTPEAAAPAAEEQTLVAPEPAAPVEEHLTWEDGPSAEPQFEAEPVELAQSEEDALADEDVLAEEVAPAEEYALPRVPFAWEDGSIADADPEEIAELVLDADAGLADRLWAARETAETVKAGEGRTRSALYRALSLAYDVAIVAARNPDEYAELLEESGVKAQARAPMTPIVKLVFGVDYDKARLTEFAAALSFAQRQDLQLGEFKDFIEKQPGGLKALVAAERQARRPEPKPDTRGEAARARLRSVQSMALSDIPAREEFAVVITRRAADGSHEAVAIVEDDALIERAIRTAA